MNCYPMFPGDQATQVFDVQHRLYMDTLSRFFRRALQRALNAEAILGLTGTDTGDFCRNITSFDHRTLQDMHDQIAAWFRFNYFRWPLLPITSPDAELDDEWQKFASQQFTNLMDDPEFGRAFFDAVQYQNQKRGTDGERVMSRLQNRRYSSMHDYRLPTCNTHEQETNDND